MTDDALDAVLTRVRDRVTPDAEERARLDEAVDRLTDATERAVADRPVEADVVHVGSTARGTWLPGDRDIDLFVRFPPGLPREDLEHHGLAIGHQVLPDGREEYAEHPYVTGDFDGFAVDLVPCFRVERAADVRSAVDRTPFHTQYLDSRLDAALAADVRLAKQLLSAIGVYGSDLRTRGFSGYLVELLTLEHGGFRPLIESAVDWHPPVRFDPEGHGTPQNEGFDDPLVVVDPTDPGRNVAAVLSTTNLARFQHYARDLCADPRESAFTPDSSAPLSAAEVRTELERRGTIPVAVRFDPPDLVDDQLYPQLERSRRGVADALDRRGFDSLRSAAFADESAVLFVELGVAERPRIERHEGPPVSARDHATAFYEKYADTDCYGPFVEGGRYVVERERTFPSPRTFLESDALFDVALGADVERALAADYTVLVGDETARLADEFGAKLARYFSPTP
ncbi:CCA tRNA nucleotidyltransferase [Halococcus saccharolyticus]|uniref:CCA-adding enzyme n=1 Tax=Halococcus saccharolyticus DSM 5350 TaxID=1227455 RepID=M0MIB7_9EURY|nr:CCA tRNA nucleotidyltransferase [Halococcus saccharolyticus]EMA44185.1 tRNA CCA-pyrophosphorylase [Halococcus saccharolyticus DSM 5350]